MGKWRTRRLKSDKVVGWLGSWLVDFGKLNKQTIQQTIHHPTPSYTTGNPATFVRMR